MIMQFRLTNILRILVSLTAVIYLAACDSTSSITAYSEKVSPDGMLVATVYIAEGGGAAGWSRYNVELRRVGEPLGTGTDLLARKTRGLFAQQAPGSIGRIWCVWVNSTTLRIDASYTEKHFEYLLKGPSELLGTTIVYEFRTF